jgi:hypothetical protein
MMGGTAVTSGGMAVMSADTAVTSAGMGRAFGAIGFVGLACCNPCVFG